MTWSPSCQWPGLRNTWKLAWPSRSDSLGPRAPLKPRFARGQGLLGPRYLGPVKSAGMRQFPGIMCLARHAPMAFTQPLQTAVPPHACTHPDLGHPARFSLGSCLYGWSMINHVHYPDFTVLYYVRSQYCRSMCCSVLHCTVGGAGERAGEGRQ